MAEIKTFRCEICGKIYHSDEVATEMVITVKEKDKDGKFYDYICPECCESITGLIKEPDLIERISERYIKANSGLNDLTNSIRSVYSSITGMCSVNPWFINNNIDVDIYTSKLKDISDKYFSKHREWRNTLNDYKSMKKSRNRWINIGSALIGFSIVLLLKLIFG